MVDEQQEEFWQEEIEVLPDLIEDIPDEKFRMGENYKVSKHDRSLKT